MKVRGYEVNRAWWESPHSALRFIKLGEEKCSISSSYHCYWCWAKGFDFYMVLAYVAIFTFGGPVKYHFAIPPLHKMKYLLKEIKDLRLPPSPYRTRLTYNCAHLRSTKESLTFEYLDISFLYHVSIGCHWLIHDGTGSV